MSFETGLKYITEMVPANSLRVPYKRATKLASVLFLLALLSGLYLRQSNLMSADVQTSQKTYRQLTILDGRPNVSRSPIINPELSLNQSSVAEKTYRILWYNPAESWMQDWNAEVDFRSCRVSNCLLHEDRSRLKTSDAVIFSISDQGLGTSPPINNKDRNPNQPWIFFSLESPFSIKAAKTIYNKPNWHGAFNWSWTYRLDSDIFHPYGVLQSRVVPIKKNYTEIFKRKTRMVAWLVSHCKTQAKREKYVRMLSKYIPVDVYGKCGNKVTGDYEKLLSTRYKFYLSFENSLCDDYITEKYFWYTNLDIIPVMRGGANYDALLPNGTYINTAKFASAKDLADYLLFLTSNKTQYTAMLKRKDQFVALDRVFTYRNALCHVCEKLNNVGSHRKSYQDVTKWLGTCEAPNDLV